MGSSASKRQAMTASTMSHREHVLERHENYIGSVNPEREVVGLPNKVHASEFVKHDHIHGLYTIQDEMLVNVCDFRVASEGSAFPVKALTVTFQDGIMSVTNDGNGIPIIKNADSGKWNPSVCLGELLSSTNYDDTKERLGGGRNGVGSAVTNIWSKWLRLQTCWQDPDTGRWSFEQEWKDNMSRVGSPR